MKIKKIILLAAVLFFLASCAVAVNYNGRILLQKAGTSQTVWYVNPANGKRYYISKSQDVEDVALALGSKQTDQTLASWKKKGVPKGFAGRFAYSLNSSGQINKLYYITASLKLIDLGAKSVYYSQLTTQGLTVDIKVLAGIASEYNLPRPTAPQPAVVTQGIEFVWPYGGKDYKLRLSLPTALYKQYADSQKYYLYTGTKPDNWQEAYYSMFLTPKAGDNTIVSLVLSIRQLAKQDNLSEDETLELAVNFVQALSYDTPKANNIKNATPNYPYETLYKKSGICTDKSLLLVAIMRQLGYGAALINYPEVNHASAAVLCPDGYAFRSTGYCYIESTGFFPIGAYPQSFGANGIDTSNTLSSFRGQFDKIFDSASLGHYLMVGKTSGKAYAGTNKTYAKVEKLKSLESSMADRTAEIDKQRVALNQELQQLQSFQAQTTAKLNSGDTAGYNDMVAQYNEKARDYNAHQNSLKFQIDLYNSDVSLYNRMTKNFYSIK